MELVLAAVLLCWIAMALVVVALCAAAAHGDASLDDTEQRVRTGIARSQRALGRPQASERRGVHL
jgi:tellurite resistance protein